VLDFMRPLRPGREDRVGGRGKARLKGAAQQAAKTIPILAIAEDLVGSGFVASLAKPGGNTTGVSILTSDLNGKRQEILFEAVPGKRIATLADTNSIAPRQLEELEDAARTAGVELSIFRVAREDDIPGALDAAKKSGAVALNVLASSLLFSARKTIIPQLAALRLPAIYQWPEITDEGGLIGYGPHITQIYGEILSRQLAALLRGTKPADIPAEQPTKYDLAINLKTAKALGLAIPPGLLARADEVIE
jgi:putative tryptophan/tyrosine transport system substrate-binding protein